MVLKYFKYLNEIQEEACQQILAGRVSSVSVLKRFVILPALVLRINKLKGNQLESE